MDDHPQPAQATPATTLREQIMNPNFGKNEREWWAARRIAELERENAKLREVLAKATEILDGIADFIDHRDPNQPELLRKLCEHLHHYNRIRIVADNA